MKDREFLERLEFLVARRGEDAATVLAQALRKGIDIRAFAGTPLSSLSRRSIGPTTGGGYNNCYLEKAEQRMKKQLAATPQKVLNIYSCSIAGGKVLGLGR